MSLRRRLFLTLCILVFAGFFGIAHWIRGELRDSYAEVTEELLVDYSRVLFAYLETEEFSPASVKSIGTAFKKYQTTQFSIKILNMVKTDPTLGLYLTDANGTVIFSTNKEEVGKDFSRWNDVYKTLHDEYGARSTRTNTQEGRSSIHYVAAPIHLNGKTVGVITLSKTESSTRLFLDRALMKMFLGGLLSVIALALIGGLMMIWITLPIEALKNYAISISKGERKSIPKIRIKEIKQLGDAFEKMRISLEGKKAIETYTQLLTHELKSPLTAIKGAAELCLEDMDFSQRQRFMTNIINEATRSHSILEQLLKIAALESKQTLDSVEKINLIEIAEQVKEALMPVWSAKKINIQIVGAAKNINGDSFLVFQTIRNLLQNAIEFSQSGTIMIQIKSLGSLVSLEVIDEGAGIPAFAQKRVFEKFYSLERPDTKRKSTGLGLSFVKEVMSLHQGNVEIQSPVNAGAGTKIILTFNGLSNPGT